MTVWAIKHRIFVNNFAYETAEINIEEKHLPNIYSFDCHKMTICEERFTSRIYRFVGLHQKSSSLGFHSRALANCRF